MVNTEHIYLLAKNIERLFSKYEVSNVHVQEVSACAKAFEGSCVRMSGFVPSPQE